LLWLGGELRIGCGLLRVAFGLLLLCPLPTFIFSVVPQFLLSQPPPNFSPPLPIL
jgi:hypothetical protein